MQALTLLDSVGESVFQLNKSQTTCFSCGNIARYTWTFHGLPVFQLDDHWDLALDLSKPKFCWHRNESKPASLVLGPQLFQAMPWILFDIQMCSRGYLFLLGDEQLFLGSFFMAKRNGNRISNASCSLEINGTTALLCNADESLPLDLTIPLHKRILIKILRFFRRGECFDWLDELGIQPDQYSNWSVQTE